MILYKIIQHRCCDSDSFDSSTGSPLEHHNHCRFQRQPPTSIWPCCVLIKTLPGAKNHRAGPSSVRTSLGRPLDQSASYFWQTQCWISRRAVLLLRSTHQSTASDHSPWNCSCVDQRQRIGQQNGRTWRVSPEETRIQLSKITIYLGMDLP